MLLETARRNAGDARSRFVDLTTGELHVADFALRRTDALLREVQARRAQGEISGLVADSGVVMVGGVPVEGGVPVASGMPVVGGTAGTGGTAVSGGVAVAAVGTSVVTVAPGNDGVYRPLLATGAMALGEGLTTFLLQADSSAPPSASGRRIDLRVPQSVLPADGVSAVPVVVRVVDARGAVVSAPVVSERRLTRACTRPVASSSCEAAPK